MLLKADFYEKVRGKLGTIGRGTQGGQMSSCLSLLLDEVKHIVSKVTF